jgi:hypothetical protein
MQHSRIAQTVLATTALMACATALPASAQSLVTPTYVGMTSQNDGVLERAKPEYDAKGIPAGGFRLFPSLDASLNFDDNVFRQKSGSETSDWYFEFTPEVKLKSEWGRHYLEVYAGLDGYLYTSQGDENLVDWTIGSRGRYDISHASELAGNAYYAERHEMWWSPNYTGFQKSPNRYYQGHVDLNWVYQPDKLGFEVGGSLDRFDWLNTPAIGGGPDINNHYRDQTEYQAYTKVFYDFSPGYSAFVRGVYDSRSFDHLDPYTNAPIGVDRSSTGYHVQGGLDLQVSHLIHGEVYVGWLTQSFNAPLKNVSGLDFGVKFDWYVSPVVTLHLSGTRQIQDVVLLNVSAADNRNIMASAEYELRPNIILTAMAFYTESRYVGTNYSDDYPGVTLGAKYLINRYLSADLSYSYTSRSTNRLTDPSFTDNIVSAGLTLHM